MHGRRTISGIPELIEHIDYRKGVYYADEGDFSAAGAAEIHYRRRLDAPFATVSAGPEGYRCIVAGFSAPLASGELVIGGEYGVTDGPGVLPEDYRHASALTKYGRGDARRRRRVLLPVTTAGRGRSTICTFTLSSRSTWRATLSYRF